MSEIQQLFNEARSLSREFLCACNWETVFEWKDFGSTITILLADDERTGDFNAACVDEDAWLEPYCSRNTPEDAMRGLVEVMRVYIAEQREDFDQLQEDGTGD